jgi:hypothetical protein
VRVQQSDGRADQSRLARAVGAEQRDHLTLADVEINVVQDRAATELNGEATDAQRNRHVQPFALRIAARLARMRLK